MLESLCGVPVLGVIPYFKDIHIEEEDSVALARKSWQLEQGKVNVAVVMLKHLSNYTDFDALERDVRRPSCVLVVRGLRYWAFVVVIS